ncbi:MAG: hypothetical protein NDJ94_19760 [Vicinamibacteria bacterium]|nr:hypothetical protein [Vicinamibacteria bacterium]
MNEFRSVRVPGSMPQPRGIEVEPCQSYLQTVATEASHPSPAKPRPGDVEWKNEQLHELLHQALETEMGEVKTRASAGPP